MSKINQIFRIEGEEHTLQVWVDQLNSWIQYFQDEKQSNRMSRNYDDLLSSGGGDRSGTDIPISESKRQREESLE